MVSISEAELWKVPNDINISESHYVWINILLNVNN